MTFNASNYDYSLPDSAIDKLLSPAMIVHLPQVRANLRRVLNLVGNDPTRWRPHLKTTKLPEVWAELPKHGIRSFKCATTREAEVLLKTMQSSGEADLLVSYPHTGANLKRLGVIASAHPWAKARCQLCELH